MYELTPEEYEKYVNNSLFRVACESAYRNGFTKEQMLSELVIFLINEKESADRKMLESVLNRISN